MRQFILLIAISLNTIFMFARDQDSVFQSLAWSYYQVDPDSTFNEFKSLPEKIQKILSDFRIQRFGNYQDNLIFHSGRLYNLDFIERNRPEVLSKNRKSLRVIPKYDLKYVFRDEQLGISQYWVNIKLDKYGQVLFCNFPDMVSSDRKIVPSKRVKSVGDSLLIEVEKGLLDAPIKIDLKYESHIGILSWQLCYLKSSGNNYRNYMCLIINAHDSSLIRKEYMVESWSYDCCPEEHHMHQRSMHIELDDK